MDAGTWVALGTALLAIAVTGAGLVSERRHRREEIALLREQIAEERAAREGQKRARLIAENAGNSGGSSEGRDQYTFRLWNAGQAPATDVRASIIDETGVQVAGPR